GYDLVLQQLGGGNDPVFIRLIQGVVLVAIETNSRAAQQLQGQISIVFYFLDISNEEFDFFLFQLLLKRGPVADVQKHPYVGVVAVKLLDHAGNDVVAKKRTQAKPDLAAGACTQSPDFVFEGVGLADDVSGQPDDLMPGMCNCDGR